MTQRVLGIDPGTHHMGYGLIDVHNWEAHYVIAGVLNAKRTLSLGERLDHIHTQLLHVVEVWHPEVIAIEDSFVPVEAVTRGGPKANIRSAIAVGQAQAVALMVAAHCDLLVFRYAPTLVKNAVSGYGQGSKEQVATMVGLLLDLPTTPSPTDASDALAVALCYVQQERFKALTG